MKDEILGHLYDYIKSQGYHSTISSKGVSPSRWSPSIDKKEFVRVMQGNVIAFAPNTTLIYEAIKVDFYKYLQTIYPVGELAKYIDYIVPRVMQEHYKDITKGLCGKQLTRLLLEADWNFVTLDLARLDDYIKDLGVDRKEFYYKIFDKRQINREATKEKIKNFLVERFDRQDLERYFPYSPLIRAHFESIPVDCFVSETLENHTVTINRRKMLYVLASNNRPLYKELKQLTDIWAEEFKAIEIEEHTNEIKITFYSEKINKDYIYEELRAYIEFLKTGNEAENWYEQRKMSRCLPDVRKNLTKLKI